MTTTHLILRNVHIAAGTLTLLALFPLALLFYWLIRVRVWPSVRKRSTFRVAQSTST